MPTTSYYITEEEKKMLDFIARKMIRSHTGVIRYLINKEYKEELKNEVAQHGNAEKD